MSSRTKRNRLYDQEAVEAFGHPAPPHVPVGDVDTRIMHGRALRSGVRPLLKVHNERFMPYLTERQQQRGKVRIARAWGRMIAMLEKTGMSMEEFVATLTPEELVRGKLRDRNGNFTGRPPAWVPAQFHQACIRELLRRGKELWQLNYLEAIEAMTQIAAGKVKGASASDRLKAAQFVVERLEGKTPEIVLVAQDEPWQVVIDEIVAQVPDEQIAAAKAARYGQVGLPVLEGEIVSEEQGQETADMPSPRRRSAARRRQR